MAQPPEPDWRTAANPDVLLNIVLPRPLLYAATTAARELPAPLARRLRLFGVGCALLVWDMLATVHPELTAATRVVSRSPELGYPPFVAHARISPETFQKMQRVLMAMSRDAEGSQLLKVLHLDGFVEGNDRLFDGIAVMARALAMRRP